MSLNINNVGNKICIIENGKYNGKIVSISDKRHDDKEDDGLIKEFKQLKIPNDSFFQLLPV
jgi:uncharacterized protein YifN (PemK superfamily)